MGFKSIFDCQELENRVHIGETVSGEQNSGDCLKRPTAFFS
jgi:hypothetical protein